MQNSKGAVGCIVLMGTHPTLLLNILAQAVEIFAHLGRVAALYNLEEVLHLAVFYIQQLRKVGY